MKRVQVAWDQYYSIAHSNYCDTFLIGKLNHNIGVLLLELDNFDGEERTSKQIDSSLTVVSNYFDESIRINKSIAYFRGLAFTYSVYVNVKIMQGKYEEAQQANR